MNRRRLLSGGAAAVVAAVTGTAVYAAGRARTPAQRAARAAPPGQSTITVAVRRGELADRLALNGVFSHGSLVEVNGPRSVPGVESLVITRVPVVARQRIGDGDVVAEVSGRPIFVLAGAFPAYRDLQPAMRGPDVAQLRRGLRPLYGTPEGDDFSGRTESDLLRLYAKLGYPALRRGGRLLLPMGEVVFLPSLPAQVSAVAARVGGPAGGPLVTLASGPPQVVAPVDRVAQQLLGTYLGGGEGGAQLRFGAGQLEGEQTRLVEIRKRAGTGGTAEGKPEFEAVFAVEGKLPADPSAGQEVLVVSARSAPGSWIVPVSALWTAADGSVSVTVVEGERRRTVPVSVSVTVLGESAVTGALAEEDQVLVGAR